LNRAVASWVTDFTHLPPADAGDVPKSALRRAGFTREVVEAATSRATTDVAWSSSVRCIGGTLRKPCGGRIAVRWDDTRGEIDWECTTCSERGVVSHFRGSESDLSSYIPQEQTLLWGFDDEARDVLWHETRWLPMMHAVIARAEVHAPITELLIVSATDLELDEIYDLVKVLAASTRSARRRALCEALLDSLSVAMGDL
jgi:hypothetical protein